MVNENLYQINLTADPKKWETCARMMSMSDPWITYGMDPTFCLKAFEGECKEVYVLEKDNEILGFVILQVCGSFRGYIQTLCVKETFRGQGLGRMLLQFCEERILKISPNIFICVSAFNKGAMKLYYDFGFKLVGELPDFIKKGITELLLRKSFGPILG
jgi:[ribosomal protein S18]-alanine N-acetyltransferase